MKFFAIFLAVVVATALAVSAETNVNNNRNSNTNNNTNKNSVITHTNATSNASCNCPSVNNNKSDNDTISELVKRLVNIQNGLSGIVFDIIAGELGFDKALSKDILKLLNIVPQIGEGFRLRLSDGEIKILLDQANNLAGPLSENPILKSFLQPLTNALLGLTIPLRGPEVKDTLDEATNTGTKLTGTGLTGALNISTGLAGQLLNLVPQINAGVHIG